MRVTSALFCEKVHVLRDGRHFAAGIFPGLLVVTGPAAGTVSVDLLVMLAADAPGAGRADMSITGPDGRQLMYDTVGYSVGDVRGHVQVVVANIPVPAGMRGDIVASVRPEGGEWAEAARLSVDHAAPAPPAITGHFGYGP